MMVFLSLGILEIKLRLNLLLRSRSFWADDDFQESSLGYFSAYSYWAPDHLFPTSDMIEL